MIPQQTGAGLKHDILHHIVSLVAQKTGLNKDSLDHIVALVAEKLQPSTSTSEIPQFRPVISNWTSYERTEPTVTTSSDELVKPGSSYDHTLIKTDLNDRLDERKALSLVPKKHWPNAIRLLDSFEARSDELSYDCQGHIFINQTSIPDSNIFQFMPLLFKKKSKTPPGFADFVNKISEMGLDHLIAYRPKEISFVSKKSRLVEGQGEVTGDFAANPKNDNWWYIGPP